MKMEEYTVKLNDKAIMKVIIEDCDKSMGVIIGKFIPLEGYQEIEQLIKDYSKLAVEFNAVELDYDVHFQEMQNNINNLGLKFYCDGREIEIDHIHLIDLSEVCGDKGYHIEVFLV